MALVRQKIMRHLDHVIIVSKNPRWRYIYLALKEVDQQYLLVVLTDIIISIIL